MPNCFCLYPKGSNAPAVLQTVDEELCKHFAVPVDPKRWFAGWYHCIGFLIAMHGYALDSPELRAKVIEWFDGDPNAWRDEMLAVLDYLKEHYQSDAWVEIGKR